VVIALLAAGSGGLVRVDAAEAPANLPQFESVVRPGSLIGLNVPALGEAGTRCVVLDMKQAGSSRVDEALEGRLELGGSGSTSTRWVHLDQGDANMAEIIRQTAEEPVRIDPA
jgi:hypothetical protein